MRVKSFLNCNMVITSSCQFDYTLWFPIVLSVIVKKGVEIVSTHLNPSLRLQVGFVVADSGLLTPLHHKHVLSELHWRAKSLPSGPHLKSSDIKCGPVQTSRHNKTHSKLVKQYLEHHSWTCNHTTHPGKMPLIVHFQQLIPECKV